MVGGEGLRPSCHILLAMVILVDSGRVRDRAVHLTCRVDEKVGDWSHAVANAPRHLLLFHPRCTAVCVERFFERRLGNNAPRGIGV